jgi:hypothetical protein
MLILPRRIRLTTVEGLRRALKPFPCAQQDSPAWDDRPPDQLDTVIPAFQIDNRIGRGSTRI